MGMVRRNLRCSLSLLLCVWLCACAGASGAGRSGAAMSEKTIQEVLEGHTDEWMSVPGVAGTAIGQFQGRPCIRILVREKTPELEKAIPSQVDGYPVVMTETGDIRALE